MSEAWSSEVSSYRLISSESTLDSELSSSKATHDSTSQLAKEKIKRVKIVKD